MQRHHYAVREAGVRGEWKKRAKTRGTLAGEQACPRSSCLYWIARRSRDEFSESGRADSKWPGHDAKCALLQSREIVTACNHVIFGVSRECRCGTTCADG